MQNYEFHPLYSLKTCVLNCCTKLT